MFLRIALTLCLLGAGASASVADAQQRPRILVAVPRQHLWHRFGVVI